ncbi:MAG: amidohydrolase [Acidobacteria bacterium]|nr:amidohydrolase [Acidobacteriota bacterium]
MKLFSAVLLSSALFAQTPNLEQLKKEAIAGVDARSKMVQEIVDMVFSFGELGFQEVETSKYLTGVLEKNGFQVQRGVAGIPTAWVATYGQGKPVIGFITDIDGIPRASQKPGVAYHDPIIEGAPGHGEGHNSGNAVNLVAAIVLKELMIKYGIKGTLKIYPGVAEELVATKAYYIRAGLMKDLDIMLGCHVGAELATSFGQPAINSGLVSIQFTFKGEAAHAAGAPWKGRSALDGVELMNTMWNYKREHLRPEQRSHYVITNGGDQPNVVPEESTVWYYFREQDFPRIKELAEFGATMAKAASLASSTTVSQRVVGSAWPGHFSKPVAEVQQKNIELIGMPKWSEADQTLARELQREVRSPKVEPLADKPKALKAPQPWKGGGSDDVGDISWIMPMAYMRYPANIPNLPGHHWANAIAEATPIAHKGSAVGAKVQAATALDYLLRPELLAEAWKYFKEVQTKDLQYKPLMADTDQPAIELNREKMDRYREQMRKFYYDPAKYGTYLEQLGITYPTLKK